MSEPLTSFERAARLFKQAEKLGCDTPTEAMIADAIQDAEFDTLHHYQTIAERHGQQVRRILNYEPVPRAESIDDGPNHHCSIDHPPCPACELLEEREHEREAGL